MSMCQEQI